MNADPRGLGALGPSHLGSGSEPPELSEGRPNALASYIRALRSHPLVVVATMLAALAASMAWLTVRGPTYEASTKILVTPVPEGDHSFVDLPLPRTSSGDPARAVHTAAELIETSAAARYAADRVEGVSEGFIRAAVTVDAIGESDIIEVTAATSDASLSAEIANAYAQGGVERRKEELRPLVEEALSNAQRALAVASDPESISLLETRLVDLKSISDGSDPTVSLAQLAIRPTASAGPPRYLVLALALVAGFAIGTVAAVLIELLVPRRLREDSDAIRIYPLPVLTRIPVLRKPPLESWRSRDDFAPPLAEAFRALRTQLEIRTPRLGGGAPGHGTLVAVASSSRGDGRTTTAIGLANAVGKGGSSAIIVDLDLQSPSLARLLGLEAAHDLAFLLAEESDPSELVTPVGKSGRVAAIAAPLVEDPDLAERVVLLVPKLLERLRARADWVILDTSPLSEASDMLTIASRVDHLVLVSRLGHTPEARLAASRDLLETVGAEPTGHVLVGGTTPAAESKRDVMARLSSAAARQPAGSR